MEACRPCAVYSAELRIRIRATGLTTYPDVSVVRPRIEVYRKNEAGRWELYEYESGSLVELASVGCTLAVDEVYRDPLAAGSDVAR
jgi:Uma2 family endonuclease